MKLKRYQREVLEAVGAFVGLLASKRADAAKLEELARQAGIDVDQVAWCRNAWREFALSGRVPKRAGPNGLVVPEWIERVDGRGRSVPHVCLKVPTAGGKTLLATAVIGIVQERLVGTRSGLVVWVVPSETIYEQTWRSLNDPRHPYRAMLDQASGGRTRLIEKTSGLTASEVRDELCVLLVMLQSAARTDTEVLRVFRDAGGFESFFPDVGDSDANSSLLTREPNLDYEVWDRGGYRRVVVRQSLANVVRLCRPVMIVDEGHRAYSEIARNGLASLAPCFVLELSATPNFNVPMSNVVVDVRGTSIHSEGMIKLPIRLTCLENTEWHAALRAAHVRLQDLDRQAAILHERGGRYIRPLMLIRVDRTGRQQRDGVHLHAEDVREWLNGTLAVPEAAVRVKSASLNEIAGEDLLAPWSPVRYIITKDALREGWDCPFAYVLSLLSPSTAQLSLTQMIGRVLRQPYAEPTGIADLDSCYVYSLDQEVNQAVEGVREGLVSEGLADVVGQVQVDEGTPPNSGTSGTTVTVALRRSTWAGERASIPRLVLHTDGARHPYSAIADIEPALNISSLRWTGGASFSPGRESVSRATEVRIGTDRAESDRTEGFANDGLSIANFAEQLLDLVLNPFQAWRIAAQAIAELRARGFNDCAIFDGRRALLEVIRADLQRQVEEMRRNEFRRLAESGSLRLDDGEFSFLLPDRVELIREAGDRDVHGPDGGPLSRSLYSGMLASSLNALELAMVYWLERDRRVRWWSRLLPGPGAHVLGWRRDRIFPDFVVAGVPDRLGRAVTVMLETKGTHLASNFDSTYKRDVFSAYEGLAPVGTQLIIRVVSQDTWRAEVAAIFNGIYGGEAVA